MTLFNYYIRLSRYIFSNSLYVLVPEIDQKETEQEEVIPRNIRGIFFISSNLAIKLIPLMQSMDILVSDIVEQVF